MSMALEWCRRNRHFYSIWYPHAADAGFVYTEHELQSYVPDAAWERVAAAVRVGTPEHDRVQRCCEQQLQGRRAPGGRARTSPHLLCAGPQCGLARDRGAGRACLAGGRARPAAGILLAALIVLRRPRRVARDPRRGNVRYIVI